MFRLNKKAQHLIEYAIVISLVAAVMVAMRTYVYRATQATLKTIEDEFFK
ncbi:MAG: hypothetical protein Q8O13_11190 [Candidatus Omnitrophota bacterium]|nr:hypothetical protein [Candidatus Omnitrophota bacterium]